MAAADYRLCDVCEQKAFYDSNLSYEWSKPEFRDTPPFRIAGKEQFDDPAINERSGMRLGYLGDWAVICEDCAKTHRTRVEPIQQHSGNPASTGREASTYERGVVAVRWPGRRKGKWEFADVNDTVPAHVLADPELQELVVAPAAAPEPASTGVAPWVETFTTDAPARMEELGFKAPASTEREAWQQKVAEAMDKHGIKYQPGMAAFAEELRVLASPAAAPEPEPVARETIATWQERMPAKFSEPEGIAHHAMMAEIRDLRAALATSVASELDVEAERREDQIGQDIEAAERHAALYEGDDRECIKTDVINSFYAGIAYERKRLAARTAATSTRAG